MAMENWFAVYITYFVPLDNIEKKRKNQKTKVSLPENTVDS